MIMTMIPKGIKQLGSILNLAIALSLLSGCALVMNGTTQRIPINTQPMGAEVYLNDEYIGMTPIELEVPRGITHKLALRQGGKEKIIQLVPEIGAEGIWGLSLSTVPAAAGASMYISAGVESGFRSDNWGLPLMLLTATIPGTVISGISLAVDVSSGAIYTLQPHSIDESFD